MRLCEGIYMSSCACDRWNLLWVGSLNHNPWGLHSGKVDLYHKCFCPIGSQLTGPISHFFFSQIFMLFCLYFWRHFWWENQLTHTHKLPHTLPFSRVPYPASDRNHGLGAPHSPHLQWGSHDLHWLFWGSEEVMVDVEGSSLERLGFAWRDMRLREMGCALQS